MWFDDVAGIGWAVATRTTRRRIRRAATFLVVAVALASAYGVSAVGRLVERGFTRFVAERAKEATTRFRVIVEPLVPSTIPSGDVSPTQPDRSR